MSNKPKIAGKWYLAGPMTNIPQFNFPLFREATAALRAQGFDITSPAEQDTPAVQTAAFASPDGKLDPTGKIGDETWGEILAKDVKLIANDIFGIIYLPNWADSRGSLLETAVALLCGRAFRVHEEGEALPRSTFWVFGEWVAGMWRQIR